MPKPIIDKVIIFFSVRIFLCLFHYVCLCMWCAWCQLTCQHDCQTNIRSIFHLDLCFVFSFFFILLLFFIRSWLCCCCMCSAKALPISSRVDTRPANWRISLCVCVCVRERTSVCVYCGYVCVRVAFFRSWPDSTQNFLGISQLDMANSFVLNLSRQQRFHHPQPSSNPTYTLTHTHLHTRVGLAAIFLAPFRSCFSRHHFATSHKFAGLHYAVVRMSWSLFFYSNFILRCRRSRLYSNTFCVWLFRLSYVLNVSRHSGDDCVPRRAELTAWRGLVHFRLREPISGAAASIAYE